MQFVIFDLEWNGSFSHKRKKIFNEIIEIGAVKLSHDLTIVDKFSILVKPQVGKKIKRDIQRLTHITNEELQSAKSFGHAFKMFGRFTKGCTLMSWGEIDMVTLVDNCEYFGLDRNKVNCDKYVDLQKYCQNYLNIENKSEQLGLTTAALLLSLNVRNIQLHRALSDSTLAAWCFQKTYSKQLLIDSLEDFDDEFYKRITFKNSFITDINNPLIRQEYLKLRCNKCGRFLKRKSVWLNKNKGFKADFYCNMCDIKYDGRIKIKIKYEGIHVTKNLKEILPEESKREETKETREKVKVNRLIKN